MFASTKTELRMLNAFYKPNTLAIPNIFKNDHKCSQIPEIFFRKGHDWFFVYFIL